MLMRTRDDLFDDEFLGRLERLHLIAKRVASGGPAGARRSRRLGDGLEFADHRPYNPGDDVRFIDWPYFARMEKLLVRLFHEHSEAGVLILLDASASMAPGGDAEKFDYARRAAAAVAYVAMGSGEQVTLAPFAGDLRRRIRTGRNRMQIFKVLDFLAGLTPQGPTDLLGCAQKLARERRMSGTLVLIGDLLDCGEMLAESRRTLLRRAGELTVLHVYSPADAAPAPLGPVMLRHAETGGDLNVNVTDELLGAYRRRWAGFARACERECLARGATYVAAPTSIPFEKLVLEALRRAGVLAG